MSALHTLTLTESVQKIKSGEISSQDLTESVLNQIEKVNPLINAYVSYDKEKILDLAKNIDRKRSQGKSLGPLAGVPIAIKDLTNVKGEEVTCCSNILKGYISPYNATIIEKFY